MSPTPTPRELTDDEAADPRASGMPAEQPEPPLFDLAEALGGKRGIFDATVPGVVFVFVNIASTLTWAIIASAVSMVVLALIRLVRHEPIRQAASGLFGMAIAAAIAALTGKARNYFLPGIIMQIISALAAIVSIVIGRPLMGYVAAALDKTYDGWQRHPALVRAASVATALWAAMFAARATVQGVLFHRNDVHSLAIVRFLMGLPLYALVVLVTFVLLRRAKPEPDDDPGDARD